MKKLALASALALCVAAPAAADPVEGVWQTQVDDGAYAHVTMAPCGPAYCGTISRTFNADGEYRSANIGHQIVRNMVPEGDGAYTGRVWRPSNDRVYLGKITLRGDRLDLRGCVAGGLICAKQVWARVE